MSEPKSTKHGQPQTKITLNYFGTAVECAELAQKQLSDVLYSQAKWHQNAVVNAANFVEYEPLAQYCRQC